MLIASQGQADEPERFVEETCDEIAFVYASDRPHCSPQVVFLRNSRILDRRPYSDAMLLIEREGAFILLWSDWHCERAVSAKKLSVYEIEPLEVAARCPWWVAPVLQLKQP